MGSNIAFVSHCYRNALSLLQYTHNSVLSCPATCSKFVLLYCKHGTEMVIG